MPNTSNKIRLHKSELEQVGAKAENCFAVLMPDDSLAPIIQKGDTLFIDSARKTINSGYLYAIELDGRYYFTSLTKADDGICLDDLANIKLDAVAMLERGFKVFGWVFKRSHTEKRFVSTMLVHPKDDTEVTA